jgi:UMF1 family MFS transporter|tara:strand:+ start:7353 stop:8609 length:1257 start_codon:yes stop_codon:yes gene_type:complete
VETKKNITKKEIYSWAFYDWANSAFATTVMAGFFPIFFKSFWAGDLSGTESSAWLGTANSIAGFAIVIVAPFLGALADISHKKKFSLGFFAFIGIIATASLFFIAQGEWFTAMIVYAIACIGFSGGNIFYDSLIINVSSKESRNRVSALGYSLGYLGGGFLFVLNVAMYLYPASFGLQSITDAVLFSFLSVSIWWAIFSIPLFKFVKEDRFDKKSIPSSQLFIESFRRVITTFRDIRKYRKLSLFLIAYWLYIDGVDTVVRMALAFGSDIGLASSDMILALIITQFVGFPATIIYGFLGDRLGLRLMLSIGLIGYVLVCIFSIYITSITGFYLLAGTIGLFQGGVQSISRTIFSQLIPPEKSAEFFGFYNLVGKSAVVFGPMLVGWVSYTFDNPDYGILSLLLLFIPGLLVLWMMPKN